MKKLCLAMLAMVASCLVLNAAPGELLVSPKAPTAANPIVLNILLLLLNNGCTTKMFIFTFVLKWTKTANG